MKFVATVVAWLWLVSTSTAFVLRPTQNLLSSSRPAFALSVTATATWAPSNMTSSAAPSPTMAFHRFITYEFPEDSLEEDHYSGIAVHVKHLKGELSRNPLVYSKVLEAALDRWRLEQRRGIWIHIPKSHAHLIEPSLQAGFEFHYCGDGDMLILKQWLPDRPSRLPLAPTHQVGVGALVLEGDKMLVVQERSGLAAAHKLWKMPTGLVDPGEDVGDAAIRELKEETGLDGTLERVVGVRQAHSEGRASDLFFICLVKLDDPEQTPVLCNNEIADLQWMSTEEYCNQETWQESPSYQELNAAIIRAAKDESAGMVEVKLPVGIRPGTNTMYIANRDK